MTTVKETKIPLRARKKAKVREALLSTSFRLFRQKGYAQTTLEEICEKCDVTVQTLLRYFGSKEDLLFANNDALMDRFVTGLRDAVRERRVIEYWASFLHHYSMKVVDDTQVREAYTIIAGAPSLFARVYAIARQYESLLEQALSEEVGVNAGEDLHSSLLAHLITMGPLEPSLRALARGDFAAAPRICDQVVQYAVDNFKRPSSKPIAMAGKTSGRGRLASARNR